MECEWYSPQDQGRQEASDSIQDKRASWGLGKTRTIPAIPAGKAFAFCSSTPKAIPVLLSLSRADQDGWSLEWPSSTYVAKLSAHILFA